ncbi:MAG: TerD family protein [Oscillospiraceae bacterium]|nr:TerD family protein [Oscillospiraceae bacterium]
MKLNIPMRLVGPLDRNSLINQLGMPGGNGMRITGAYNTQSLLRQFGPQNAIGYGMNPVNGMNGMNMGMAATAAVAAAAMMQDDHQNYGTPYQNNQNYGPGYQNGPNNGQNYQNNQNYGQAYQNDQNYGQSQDSSAYPNGRPSYADYIDPPSQNQGQVYSTPQPQNQGQVYSTPRPQNQGQVYSTPGPQGQGQVYSTPRPQNQGQVYSTPRPQNPAQNYSTPRPQNQTQNYSAPQPQNQRQTNSAPPQQRPAPAPALQPVQQNNAPKTKAPSLPSGGKVLQRGQKIPLGADLHRMRIGLRWDVKDPGCELDASAFLLAENEKVPSEDWFIFYGQVQSPDESTRYQGYDLGGSDLMINLDKVSQNVKKISMAVTIYEAVARNQNFSKVNSVSAVIINIDSGQVVASVDLTNCSSVVTALVVGEFYRHNGEWKFNAVGSGVSRDLAGFCKMYDVELE